MARGTHAQCLFLNEARVMEARTRVRERQAVKDNGVVAKMVQQPLDQLG